MLLHVFKIKYKFRNQYKEEGGVPDMCWYVSAGLKVWVGGGILPRKTDTYDIASWSFASDL